MFNRMLIVIVAALSVSGCDSKVDRQQRWIDWFFAVGETGSSRDYYLVGGAFVPSRVAVVYGMGDDGAFCRELAELYMQRYTASNWYCEPAN